MKLTSALFATLLLTALGSATASEAASDLSFQAGDFRMSLDSKGNLQELSSTHGGTNYLQATRPSPLLTVQEAGIRGYSSPVELSVISRDQHKAQLKLKYESGAVATIDVVTCDDYLKFTLSDYTSERGIESVKWGPYSTTMEGLIADLIGLTRSDTFTIGLLGLDIKTGSSSKVIQPETGSGSGGSEVQAVCYDYTKDKIVKDWNNLPSHVTGSPGLNVKGSSVALLGCETPRELDVIEKIELAEGLPHPTIKGVWAKRSPQAMETSFWSNYNESNIDQWVELLHLSKVNLLCRYNPFGNWGHFQPNPKEFPHGMEGLRMCSKKSNAKGIRTTMYTLSAFITSWNLPEPFLSPIPDKRLKQYPVKLGSPVDMSSSSIRIKSLSKEILEAFEGIKKKDKARFVIRVDDELIDCGNGAASGDSLSFKIQKRGYMNTKAVPHGLQSNTGFMKFIAAPYYQSFQPGEDSLNLEVGQNIGKTSRSMGATHIILDGFEAVQVAGHGRYSANAFLKEIYDIAGGNGITYASSGLVSSYSWHVMSNESWGENDKQFGIRGNLNSRLKDACKLKRNLLPVKLGQFYPNDKTTNEEMDMLMALAVGYDAGVDFKVGSLPHNRQPYLEAAKWEELRKKDTLTRLQKLALQQTDSVYKLVQGKNGLEPCFVRRYRDTSNALVNSFSAPAKVVTSESGKIAPRSIDMEWTHSPGILERSCITDDLVHSKSNSASEFEVQLPWNMSGTPLLFVLRVPEKDAAPLKNPRLIVSYGANLSKTYQLRMPTTLQPGSYLSVPLCIPQAYVYNSNHQVTDGIEFNGIPLLDDKTNKVRVRLESDSPDVPYILNLRFTESLDHSSR